MLGRLAKIGVVWLVLSKSGLVCRAGCRVGMRRCSASIRRQVEELGEEMEFGELGLPLSSDKLGVKLHGELGMCLSVDIWSTNA